MAYDTMAILLGVLTGVLILRVFVPNQWTLGLFAITLVAMSAFVLENHASDVAQGWASVHGQARTFVDKQLQPHPEHVWPPVVGQAYPDLRLIDQDGRRTSLSEFKGKVILVEPVGMPCPACIAFAGGQASGSYDGVAPQPGLGSIHDYVRRFGRVRLDRDDIVFVQIVFYSPDLTAPTTEQVRDWATHFSLNRSENEIVLAAEPYLLSAETRAMIPGFQLIDKDFVLRFDSAGHTPQHDLYQELLPAIGRLAAE